MLIFDNKVVSIMIPLAKSGSPFMTMVMIYDTAAVGTPKTI